MAIFQDAALNNEGNANRILETLKAFVEQEGSVSLAILYDLIGFPTMLEDHKVGWTTMDGVKVVPDDDGFALTLPEPQKLS